MDQKNESIWVPIETLFNDPSNVRKHSEANILAIMASISKFGQRKPLVIDKNNIVLAGNGSLEAMRRLGIEKVWVNKTDLEGVSAIGFALADNKTAELAEWDTEGLAKTLGSLKIEEFDIESIGFDLADAVIDQELYDQDEQNEIEKFSLEVSFPNKDEMMTYYDRLVTDGLIVRIR